MAGGRPVSIFGNILNKIMGRHGDVAQVRVQAPAGTPPVASARPAPAPAQQAAPLQAAPAQSAAQPIDIEAVLTQMTAAKGEPSNWRTSIVDLLKLLDLDSSLQARKALAQEIGYGGPLDGSAEMNIALHKAVMTKLAQNGGKVPADLRD
jgi:3-oxoacyl-ACP reductase-like protein